MYAVVRGQNTKKYKIRNKQTTIKTEHASKQEVKVI